MERSLTERCVAGDRVAWREFVALHRPPVVRLLAKLVPEDSIDDLEQEVWLRLFANDLRALRAVASAPPASVLGLVLTIARNLACDHLRHRGATAQMEQRLGAELRLLSADADRTSLDAERRTFHALAVRANATEAERELLRRYLDLGLTPQEIALADPTIGFQGVRTRLRRLLQRMRLAARDPDTS